MSDRNKTLSDHIVIVGSSAGGIEALLTFVGTLPTPFPASIVLAQHLDPKHPSILDTLLQRRSSLPVKKITAHTSLEPGVIYVAPPNCYVTVQDGYVEMQDHLAPRPKPSVDVLLSSAARTYGSRLIAVILTGSGTDGAAGAIEVKRAGGTVIIQNPQTARFSSMPLALPPTIVDFQVDLERLGPLLYALLTGAAIPPDRQNEDVLHLILEQVKNHVHIDLHKYQMSILLQLISTRMAVIGMPTMRDYLNYLQSTPAEVNELVQVLIVPATQFFRNPDVFASLKRDILPEIVARARTRRNTLRFWVAGCATGEEAYSLAMLLTDVLGAELPLWNIKIFATEMNETALHFARQGFYAENLLTGLSPEDVQRFFSRLDHGYRIARKLRHMVIFGIHDLSRDAPFPHIDLLVCRNVLSSFIADFQESVLNQLTLSLFPGGYLLLDKTEAIEPPCALYERVSKDGNVYRCIGYDRPLVPYPDESSLKRAHFERRSHYHPAPTTTTLVNKPEVSLSTFDPEHVGHVNELLLRSLPIGIVVIDRDYRIITANGPSRHLLGLGTATGEQDFLHAVPGIPYTEVRNAIDAAFEEGSTITFSEVELKVNAGGNGRFLALSIAPIRINAATPQLAALSVIDITKQIRTRRHLEALQAEQAQLVNELSTANKRLQEVNIALLNANEQLQTANEEMSLAQEEWQAGNEELETTNEELQADLEELETTNEESETIREELRAHTEELQEEIERERRQFAEIIDHAPFSVLRLHGPDLLVETFSSHYTRRVNGHEVRGRPLKDVYELFWGNDPSLIRLANEVYQHDTPQAISRRHRHMPKVLGEAEEGEQVYTLVPTHEANGKVSGVIIYALDEAKW